MDEVKLTLPFASAWIYTLCSPVLIAAAGDACCQGWMADALSPLGRVSFSQVLQQQGRDQRAALALGAELLLGAEDGNGALAAALQKCHLQGEKLQRKPCRKFFLLPLFSVCAKPSWLPACSCTGWCRWEWGAGPGSVSVAPLLGWEGMHAAVWINDDQQMQSQRACPCTDLSWWDLLGKKKRLSIVLHLSGLLNAWLLHGANTG